MQAASLLQQFLPRLPKNPKLADLNALSQMVKLSQPAAQPILDRKQMLAQNPMNFVGDDGTGVSGRIQNGLPQIVDPRRTVAPTPPNPVSNVMPLNPALAFQAAPSDTPPAPGNTSALVTREQQDSLLGKSPVEDPENTLAVSIPAKAEQIVGAKPRNRREQIKDDITQRQGKTFNEKRGVMNSLKAAGIGFLQAFNQTDPSMRFTDRLLQAAGGGAAGLAGGTIDPNLAAKIWNKKKLGELYGQYGQATEMEEADAKTFEAQQKAAKAGIEVEGAGIKNVNDRVGDLLKTYTSDNNIDEMEASVLSKMTGLPYSANDWRKVIRTDEQGVPFISRDGEEQSRIDPSRPLNPSAVPKERKIDGQGTFTVSDDKAFPVAGNMAVGNANRADAASRFATTQEVQAADREYKDSTDYESDNRSYAQRVRKANADGAAAQKRLTVFANQLTKAQESKAAIAAQGYDTTEIDRQIGDIESRKATAEGEVSSANVLAGEPAPKKIIRPKNPKTSKGGKNNNIGSSDEYQRTLNRIRPNK